MNSKDKVKQIIEDNLYLTIATSDPEGNPWVSNLYFACDSKYNFYWYSSFESKHSALIQKNPKVAVSIFNSTAIGDDVDAVYITGKVKEVVKKTDLIKGLTIYGKKMLKTGFMNSKSQIADFVKGYRDFRGLSKLRLYKLTPERIWKLAPSKIVNGKYVDGRVEIKF